MTHDHAVATALRLFGLVDLGAVVAVAMPFAAMSAIHARLGLGELPAAPIVEYLARHTSLWYAAHAATLLFLSTDVPRYRPAVRFLGWLGLGFAAGITGVNVASGMPPWWVAAHAAGAALDAVVLLTLVARAERVVPTMTVVPADRLAPANPTLEREAT